MTSPAAFCFLSIVATLIVSVTATCNKSVSCPCGTSNNFTFCIDGIVSKGDPCDRWNQCKTCQENLMHCSTCPPNRTGISCSQVKQTRRKRQYGPRQSTPRQFGNFPIAEVIETITAINPRFYGSCPRLESPELGSLSCRQTNNYRSCTGRCLPGYTFEDEEDVGEITLQCRRNTWVPRRGFPPCRSEGLCDVEAVDGGFFNCTTGMGGTRCDASCDGLFQGRYHCYPGRGWRPTLPYCLRERGGNGIRNPCSCQNGGTCDIGGECLCPRGWTGTYCERVQGGERTPCLCQNRGFCANSGECICPPGWRGPFCERTDRPRTSCPDPGTPRGGDRMNEDGTPSYPRGFQEGEFVIYSCRDSDSALEGSTLIRCQSDGNWSAPLPRCVRSQNPPIVCPDPGVISNGDRLNTDGSPSESDQIYTPGQSVVYTCRPGYALHGTSMKICLRTGRWSNRAPRCSRIRVTVTVTTESPSTEGVSCSHPGVDANGILEDHPLLDPRRGRQRFPAGTELKFDCREGYRPRGAVILYCLRTGDWSSFPPTCEENEPSTVDPPAENRSSCQHPGVDPNGEIEDTPLLDPRRRGQRFPPGSELTYTCKDGYLLEGSNLIFCLLTGEWSAPIPTCRLEPRAPDPDNTNLMQCENLGPISNGRVVVYRTLDERRRPEDLANEDDDTEYPAGTRLQYSCEVGYVIRGNHSLICETSGFWSTEPPICVEDCGRSLLQTTRRITHGTKTEAGEWPWTVAISITRNNVTSMICGGALLDRRTVLTAAHCLTDYPYYTLYFGKFHRRDRDDDGKVETRITLRIVSHPDFNNETYDNDIALLKFGPNIRYSERIQPICLPTPGSTAANLFPGNKGYVTGWGITEKNLPSDELMMAHLPIQSDQACMLSYDNQGLPLRIRPGMFCAGFEEGVVSACRGDSGSPLVFYDRASDRHTIEGLVSFGVEGQCGMPGRFTVFTKVAEFMPWILRNWPR